MKVSVCCNLSKEKTREIFPEVVSELKKNGFTPLVEERNRIAVSKLAVRGVVFGGANENADACDLFLTIGGDGTILRWGKLAARRKKPLLGINTGRLGFMATLECDSISSLADVASGKYRTSRRMMLDVELVINGKSEHLFALNDVVLFKETSSKLPEYVVCCGGYEVTKIRADGLIISTPTGSTAYSLSAGGPIIDPKLECFELTAMSPHSLFNRSMIFSGREPLEAKYCAYENCGVFVSVDGGASIELAPVDRVVITKSDMYLELIEIEGSSFFDSVHNKLLKPLK